MDETGRYILVHIEDLHKHIGVEDRRLKLSLFLCGSIGKNLRPSEIQYQGDRKLIDRLSDDHFPHRYGDEGCGFRFRISVQDVGWWRIRSKCQRC